MDCINYILTALKYAGLLLLIGFVPWIVIACIMQLLSKSIRKSLAKVFGIQGYIYLTCPGVMVHEIGHALFCIIFRHRIVEMQLFAPEADGTLGYVKHSYDPNSLYQRIGNFFIGTGPIWFGVVVLSLLSRWLLPGNMQIGDPVDSVITGFLSLDFWMRWQSYVWLYLTLTVASHITLSPPDLSGAADGGGVMVITLLSGFLLFGWCGEWERPVIEFFKNLVLSSCGIFSFVLILLLIFCIVCKIIAWKK